MRGAQLDDKEIPDSKDAMLRLHQSLATMFARATPRPDGAPNQYVVQTEVVACHIDLSRPNQKELPLWLAKNTAWDQNDKKFVDDLLAHLQEITHNNLTVDNVHSRGRLPDLTTLIYGYCQHKVWSRLGKLLLDMRVLTLPQAIRESRENLEVLLQRYEDKNSSLNFRLWKLADASNYCRRNPMSSKNAADWPTMVKRWNKVASYSASFNNVVTWALGAGSYVRHKGKFLGRKEVIYYKPLTRTIDDFTRATLDAHFSPAYRTENPEERKNKIAALTPIAINHKDHDEEIFVHAEMHMAPSLARLNDNQYIGISKLCCFMCIKAIHSLKGPNKIVVKGTHNKLYPKWQIPQAPSNVITMDPQELKTLENHLDQAIVKEIHRTVGVPITADSIANSQNSDDIDAQPNGPVRG